MAKISINALVERMADFIDFFDDFIVWRVGAVIVVGAIGAVTYYYRETILLVVLFVLAAAEESHSLLLWIVLFGTLVNFVLLLWILWRQPTPWRSDTTIRRLFERLNRIEAAVRVTKLADLEEEEASFWQDVEAAERGRPWFGPRWW